MANMKHVTFDERLKQLETDLEKKNSLNRELFCKKAQFATKSASMESTCNDLMVVVREKTEKMPRCTQANDMSSVDLEWRKSLELNAKRMSEQLKSEREAFQINAQSQMNIMNMMEAELKSIRIDLERQKINDKNEIQKQREELQQNMNILSIQREELWQKEVAMDLQRESINAERKEIDEARNELKLVQNRFAQNTTGEKQSELVERLTMTEIPDPETLINELKVTDQLQKQRERLSAEIVKLEAERNAFRNDFGKELKIKQAELESIRIDLERQKINDKNEIEKQREELQQNMNILSIQREKFSLKEIELNSVRMELQMQRETLDADKKANEKTRHELNLQSQRLQNESEKLMHLKQDLESAESKLEKDRSELVLQKEQMTMAEVSSQETLRHQLEATNQHQKERERIRADIARLKVERQESQNEIGRKLKEKQAELKCARDEYQKLMEHFDRNKTEMELERKQHSSAVDKLGMERVELQNEIEVQREQIEEERNELKLEKDIMAREQRIIHLERANLERESEKLMRSKQELESQQNILERDQIEDERKQLESDRLQLRNAVEKLIADRAELEQDRSELTHQNEQINAMTRTEIESQETHKFEMEALRQKLENEAVEIKKERENLLRDKEAAALRYIESEAGAQKLAQERQQIKEESEILNKERQEFRKRVHELDSVRVKLQRKDRNVRLWLMTQSEQQEKLRGHEQFQIRNLMSALAQLWELFDESPHLTEEVRLNAVSIQLDQIRGEWISVTQAMREFVDRSQTTQFNTE